MHWMDQYLDRGELRAWMRRVIDQTGWSARAWADKAKTSASNITRFLAKDDAPLPNMRTLAKLAAVAPSFPPPFPGSPPPEKKAPDYPAIREVTPRAGMGAGGIDFESLNVTDANGNVMSEDVIAGRWWLPDDYLARELKVSAKTAWIIEVQGDSMEPTLRSGDRVMVDMAQKRPSPPGIFALWDGLGIVVKRLEYVPGSDPATVEIISDNAHHKPYSRTVEEAHIIGRVVWYARKL